MGLALNLEQPMNRHWCLGSKSCSSVPVLSLNLLTLEKNKDPWFVIKYNEEQLVRPLNKRICSFIRYTDFSSVGVS